MQNRDPLWQAEIQKLQAISIGTDIKKQLINCLDMCNKSHSFNIGKSDLDMSEIIGWDGENDPLPDGWYLDPVDNFFKKSNPSPSLQEGELNG